MAADHAGFLSDIFCDEGISFALSPDGVAALAGAAHLCSLRDLVLTRTRVQDAGASALAQSPYLRDLHTLELYDCEMTGRGVRDLAASPVLAGLVSLAVTWNVYVWMGDMGVEMEPDSDAALRALAESPHLGKLEYLKLGYNTASEETLRALRESPCLPEIKQLDLETFD
jgi:hypothetical protein